jgi:hypothetical protein
VRHSSLLSQALRRVTLAACLLPVFSCGLLEASPVPSGRPAIYPAWWFERDVIERTNPDNATPSWPGDYPEADDFAAINQGQLKYLAGKAAAQMNLCLPGRAGAVINNLAAGWGTPGTDTDDFAVVNLGQLKAVAQPFYDRLIALGYATDYPWALAMEEADDYAIANMGQAKQLFSFALILADSDHDGVPDWWELLHPGNLGGTGGADTDGDSVSDHDEFQNGTDPDDYYNGQIPVIEIIMGNNQFSAPDSFAPLALAVKIHRGDAGKTPYVNAPAVYTVADGAALATSSSAACSSSLSKRSNAAGKIFGVFAKVPGSTSTMRTVTVSAGTGAPVTFTLSSNNPSVAPHAPSSLRIYRQSSGDLILFWNDDSSNEDGFVIERSDDNGSTWVQVATAPASSTRAIIPASQAGTASSIFRVKAVKNLVGSSNPSSTVQRPDHTGGPGNPDNQDDADSDEDGLTDAEEIQLGTDPEKKDTDGDGVLDPEDGWANVQEVTVPRLGAPHYAVIDLGLVSEHAAVALNNKGAVLGFDLANHPGTNNSYLPSELRIWKSGVWQTGTKASGMDEEGEIVQSYLYGYPYTAWWFAPGRLLFNDNEDISGTLFKEVNPDGNLSVYFTYRFNAFLNGQLLPVDRNFFEDYFAYGTGNNPDAYPLFGGVEAMNNSGKIAGRLLSSPLVRDLAPVQFVQAATLFTVGGYQVPSLPCRETWESVWATPFPYATYQLTGSDSGFYGINDLGDTVGYYAPHIGTTDSGSQSMQPSDPIVRFYLSKDGEYVPVPVPQGVNLSPTSRATNYPVSLSSPNNLRFMVFKDGRDTKGPILWNPEMGTQTQLNKIIENVSSVGGFNDRMETLDGASIIRDEQVYPLNEAISTSWQLYYPLQLNQNGGLLSQAIKDENEDGQFNIGTAPAYSGPDKKHNVLLVPMAFIRQTKDSAGDNIVVPAGGEKGCLMVSKWITNYGLNATQGFDFTGPAAAASTVWCYSVGSDPDTYRVQFPKIADAANTQVKIETYRDGQPLGNPSTFGVVAGTQAGQDVLRINQSFRLVSNKSDDEDYLPEQTILVKLGDTVRATILLNNQENGFIEMPVGRPPAENGRNAIRTVDVNWTTIQGAGSKPAYIVNRMSEMWAQAGVKFNLVASKTVTPVTNVLIVSGDGSDLADVPFVTGSLSVNVIKDGNPPVPVSITFTHGDGAEAVAHRLATALTQAGFNSSAFRNGIADPQSPGEWIIRVCKGQQVYFADEISSNGSMKFYDPVDRDLLIWSGGFSDLKGHVLGLNFSDDDPTTVEYFGTPYTTMGVPGNSDTKGVSRNTTALSGIPGWANTAFLIQAASDDSESWPKTPSHEMGHILMQGPLVIHWVYDSSNIMDSSQPGPDTITYRKRLTDEGGYSNAVYVPQHSYVRQISGEGADPQLLKKK